MKESPRVIPRPRRALPPTARAAAVGITAALALLAAACGSNPSSTDSSGSSNAGGSASSLGANAQDLAYAQCMRSHGVSDFPDPNSSGQFDKNTLHQLAASNPQYQTATNSCHNLLPNGGNGPSQAQLQQQRTYMEEFAQCMRTHGVPNFPGASLDPTGRLVINLSGTGIDPQSPQISSKIHTCESVFPASMGVPGIEG